MEHFVFPGNLDFATDEHGTFSCIIHERLLSLFIVYETNVYNRWIMINFPCKWHTSTTSASKSSSRKIFHGNSPRARTLTSNSAWTMKEKTTTRNCGAERTSLSTAKATPTTRDRGTEEQETGISEALWSFYTVENPNLLVCRFPCGYIDQSLQSFSGL